MGFIFKHNTLTIVDKTIPTLIIKFSVLFNMLRLSFSNHSLIIFLKLVIVFLAERRVSPKFSEECQILKCF